MWSATEEGDTVYDDLIPMLICRDVQASVRFYCDVLGFRVKDEMADVGKTGWASIECGRAALMLASPTYVPEAPTVDGRHPQAIHYFYPRDLDAVHQRVEDAGWPVGAIEERFYGMREFEVVDPSGHVLCFGQDVGRSDQSERSEQHHQPELTNSNAE